MIKWVDNSNGGADGYNSVANYLFSSLKESNLPIEKSILEQNIDKVCWWRLSGNPNAIHILKQNVDKIKIF